MNNKQSGRRRFLKEGAALVSVAVGAIRSPAGRGQTLESQGPEGGPKDTRAYGERSRFVASVRTVDQTGLLTPLQHSVGIITPSALHNVQSRGYDPPDIDPRQHRLLIHGRVERPLIFTMEELKRLPSVSRIYFIECGGNSARTAFLEKAKTVQQTHGKTSCAEWTGVPLSLLLQEAGAQKGASWLVAEGAEKGNRTQSIPLEKALDDVLVAYGQSGEPLRPEQGYPVRLLLPGWAGGISIKWLRRIKVVDQPYMSKQETSGRSPDLVEGRRITGLPPKSVITFPSGGQRLVSRGFYEITGLAWSGAGAIRRVEVSTDGGRHWKDAALQDPVVRFAHTRFRFPWTWDGEETVLQSRCTDERGQVQPTLAEVSRVRDVTPDNFWQSVSDNRRESATQEGLSTNNVIFSWRVSREGSVHNAMF